MSTIPTALRTLDTRHFGGWIYLVHLIVIYTMMYLIPTEIIFCSPRTNGSGSVWLINASGDVWLFGTSGSLYVDGSYGSPMTAADIVTYGAWDVWTSGAVEFYNGYAFSSYGLYSPDTSDIQFVWMVFPSGFINHNLDYTISYSYGSALRARKIPMALGMSTLLAASSSTTITVPTAAFRRTRMIHTMHVLCGRLVLSSTATTVSAIPTEYFCSLSGHGLRLLSN